MTSCLLPSDTPCLLVSEPHTGVWLGIIVFWLLVLRVYRKGRL